MEEEVMIVPMSRNPRFLPCTRFALVKDKSSAFLALGDLKDV